MNSAYNTEIVKTEKHIHDFLELPKHIYKTKNLTTNTNTEEQILRGTHVLSHYFDVIALLTYKNNEPISRLIITIYHDTPNEAYIGFFESYMEVFASREIFNKSFEILKEMGVKNIMGPVDSSFWISYRMKVNNFNKPYAFEPYNLPYYIILWKKSGFSVKHTYYSNCYRKVKKTDRSDKLAKRLDRMYELGYTEAVINDKNIDYYFNQVYLLMSSLYKTFPTYREITEEQFNKMFNSFKKLIKYNMTKIIEKDNKVVAFLVTSPDYGNLINRELNKTNILKILIRKQISKNCIILYMGVDEKHKGLASALAELIKIDLYKYKCKSVGALIIEGKPTNTYYKDLIKTRNKYVLLEKHLE